MADSNCTGGYWQWSRAAKVPHSLVELIESGIGALPPAVGTVIDVLAVGEPIELSALQRITDPDAVEEADIRGLISVEQVAGRLEVRVAHPLYGEVRRNRAATTTLRRLRGLVAAELAVAENRRRRANPGPPRGIDPRLRSPARWRSAGPGRSRCGLPRRSFVGQPAGRGGNPGRRRTRSNVHPCPRVVVARRWIVR